MVSHNAYLNVNIATVKPGEQTTWERWHPGEQEQAWPASAWEPTQQAWEPTQAWEHTQAWAPTQAWEPTQASAWQPDVAWEPTQHDTAWEPTQENPHFGATTHH
jgi:hypothetical protein